jgi:hypothetical protein
MSGLHPITQMAYPSKMYFSKTYSKNTLNAKEEAIALRNYYSLVIRAVESNEIPQQHKMYGYAVINDMKYEDRCQTMCLYVPNFSSAVGQLPSDYSSDFHHRIYMIRSSVEHPPIKKHRISFDYAIVKPWMSKHVLMISVVNDVQVVTRYKTVIVYTRHAPPNYPYHFLREIATDIVSCGDAIHSTTRKVNDLTTEIIDLKRKATETEEELAKLKQQCRRQELELDQTKHETRYIYTVLSRMMKRQAIHETILSPLRCDEDYESIVSSPRQESTPPAESFPTPDTQQETDTYEQLMPTLDFEDVAAVFSLIPSSDMYNFSQYEY